MPQIIVEIFVPAINKSFDFALPSDRNTGDVMPAMIKALEKVDQSLVIDGEEPILCHIEEKRILRNDISLECQGVKDGSRLMIL